MNEGEVVEWVVGASDAVETGDVIAAVESEKTVAEIEAREDGLLRLVLVESGHAVSAGTPLGIVAAADEEISTLVREAESELGTTGGDRGPERSTESRDEDRESAEGTDEAPRDVKATPKAKKLAREHGVALDRIDAGDVISADDVTESIDETARHPREERPLSGIRGTIADRLGTSYREAVHVTEFRTVDAERLFEMADAAEEALAEAVSIIDLLVRAVSLSLRDHPELNATLEGGVHRLYDEHDISIAVDTEAGLVTPVIRNVETKSLAEIVSERASLTSRSVAGDYDERDITGGTFTISNLGPYGIDSFTPIINPPQVAILGVGSARKRAVPANGDVEVRRLVTLSLTFDHRAIDGADGADFLATLSDLVEDGWSV